MTSNLNEYFKTHNMFRKSNYNVGEIVQHIESPNCELMCKYMPGTMYNPSDKSCKCLTGFKNLITLPNGLRSCSDNIQSEETHYGFGTFGNKWQDNEADDIHAAVCPYGMSKLQTGIEGSRYKYSYRCNEYPIDSRTSNQGPFEFQLRFKNPSDFQPMCPTDSEGNYISWMLTNAPYMSKFFLHPQQNHILLGTCSKPNLTMLIGTEQTKEMPMYDGSKSTMSLDCSHIPGAIITNTSFVASDVDSPDQPWKAKYNCTYYR